MHEMPDFNETNDFGFFESETVLRGGGEVEHRGGGGIFAKDLEGFG